MIKDFYKINIFLTLAREKSFSKASKKLGISQPAVTQQIRLLEQFLGTTLIDRKKSGILLTKDGERIYDLSLDYEKFIYGFEKEVFNLLGKEVEFRIGTTSTIGNYVLPKYIANLKSIIGNDIFVKISEQNDIMSDLKNNKLDLAICDDYTDIDGCISHEWLNLELTICSNVKLPETLTKNQLFEYKWICRGEESSTRRVVKEAFKKLGISCNNFDIISTLTTDTSIKHTLLNSDKNTPILSILPRHVLENEIRYGNIFVSSLEGAEFFKAIHIYYQKEKKHDVYLKGTLAQLQKS